MKNLLQLFLQLFADEEDEVVEEPADEVENDPVETGEDETEVESEEEESDPDFNDGEEQEEEAKKVEKSKKEQNAINAQRRIQEKHEKELREARSKSYFEGLKEGVGGKNPYTGETIEDEFDMEVLQTMREMEKKGLDPVEDFAKYSSQKAREQRKAQQEEEAKKAESDEKIKVELQEFDKAHGEGSANKLFNDTNFTDKYGKYLGRLSLEEVYELYLDSTAEIEAKAEEKAIQNQARGKSSPGVPGNKAGASSSFIEDIMSDDKKFREFQESLMNKY